MSLLVTILSCFAFHLDAITEATEFRTLSLNPVRKERRKFEERRARMASDVNTESATVATSISLLLDNYGILLMLLLLI